MILKKHLDDETMRQESLRRDISDVISFGTCKQTTRLEILLPKDYQVKY